MMRNDEGRKDATKIYLGYMQIGKDRIAPIYAPGLYAPSFYTLCPSPRPRPKPVSLVLKE